MSERGESFAEALSIAGGLKRVPRTGWIDRGIPAEEIESVADHSWRVALMAWLLSIEIEGLDRERVVQLALVHDLAEVLVGDQTPYDREALASMSANEQREHLEQRQVRSEEQQLAKKAAESRAVQNIAARLPEKAAVELIALWRELLERKTPEAKFLKELDILETFLQSREYLELHPDAPVRSFLLETSEELRTPLLQSIRDAAISPNPRDE